MRKIRPSGSEGGVALTTPLLPLSKRWRGWLWLLRPRDRSRSGREANRGPLGHPLSLPLLGLRPFRE